MGQWWEAQAYGDLSEETVAEACVTTQWSYTSAPPGCLVELQNLRLCSGPVDSESAFGTIFKWFVNKLGLGSPGNHFCETVLAC